MAAHAHGATIGSNNEWKQRSALSVYLDERNRLVFNKRLFPGDYPLTVALAAMLIGRYALKGAYRNYLTAMRGWLAGLSGEQGPPAWLKARKPTQD